MPVLMPASKAGRRSRRDKARPPGAPFPLRNGLRHRPATREFIVSGDYEPE